MLLPGLKRVLALSGAFLLAGVLAEAQPIGVVSTVRHEGTMITSKSDPQIFIFRSGPTEEHFDGTSTTMTAQGGYEVGEPITGLRYIHPRLSVDGPPYTAEDMKLIDGQFHGASTADYYLFRTVEGQLFFLPKEGETAVIRVDYRLKDKRTVTIWMRK